MKTLLIDNGDSYGSVLSSMLADAFGSTPIWLHPGSAELRQFSFSGVGAVVIGAVSGEKQLPAITELLEKSLELRNVPVLAVGMGAQIVGEMCGLAGTPESLAGQGTPATVKHLGDDLFSGIPELFQVGLYQSVGLGRTEPADLQAIAWASDGSIMSFRHRTKPWWGVRFHPESIASEYGDALLVNFAALCGKERPGKTLTMRVKQVPLTAPLDALFQRLFDTEPLAFWLDSSDVRPGLSRFSFLGASTGNLRELIQGFARTGIVQISRDDAASLKLYERENIFDALNRHLLGTKLLGIQNLPFDFTGGYVGYFGYESDRQPNPEGFDGSAEPDSQWMLATRMIAVDHETETTWIMALTDENPGDQQCADSWLTYVQNLLQDQQWAPATPQGLDQENSSLQPENLGVWNRPKEQYLTDIAKCQRLISQGDSLEVCLTNTLTVPAHGEPLAAYLRLRRINPAPYSAYYRFDDLHVLCSSPERFLKIDRQGIAESKPIKGTAARSDNPRTDLEVRKTLASNPKTQAENLVVVDLLRSEMSKVSVHGSVSVPNLMHVESYATVHQLVSTVRGELRPDISAVGAARVLFPPGSMTGVPKRQTIDIIERLEPEPRGIYSGATGFLAFNGTADLNVVIRTAVIQGDHARIGAGGAIVTESVPEEEYAEILLKARAVVRAVSG